MITPHFSQYRMAWPFSFGDFSTIDTGATDPVWSVPGHFRTPPPEVCDLLTAASFDIDFEINAAAFNSFYSEALPSNVIFAKTVNSGTWFESVEGVEATWNSANTWDTQAKLFERYIDYTEDFTNVDPFGFCGARWFKTLEFSEEDTPLGYYTVSAALYASVPVPAKNLSGEYFWTVTSNIFLVIEKYLYASPGSAVGYYAPNPGLRYLGVDHLGGQGAGEGGAFPVVSIEISSTL
jgi:hypothetical protein